MKDYESKSEEEKNKLENYDSLLKVFALLYKNQVHLITDDSFKVTNLFLSFFLKLLLISKIKNYYLFSLIRL